MVPIGVAVPLAFTVELWSTDPVPHDSVTYLAAGERLNAGHQLYALMPGDRLMTFRPPFQEVPLLSPPLIGVLFRPLALLPADLGAYVWRDVWAAALLVAVGAMLARLPVPTAAALIPLSVSLAYQLVLGNLEGPLFVGTIAAWLLVCDGRSGWAGGLMGVLTVLKLTPIPLAWWVVTQGGRHALLGYLAGVLVGVLVGVAGSGVGAHLTYLDVIQHTTLVGTTDWSLAGLARDVGVPAATARWLPSAFAVVAMITTALFRRNLGVSFVAAVLGSVFGSPVVYYLTLVRLLTVLVPWAWPWSREVRHPREAGGLAVST